MVREGKFKKGALAAVLAALTFLTTYFIRIPSGFNGGYIHPGDAVIYLAASILPGPYAMAAAGIGAALSDVLSPGGIVWAIPTLIIKPVLTLYFTASAMTIITKRNVIAVFLAGITGLAGYYLAGSVISGNFIAPLLELPFDALQPLASGILFVVVGAALDKVNLKQRFFANRL